MTGLELEGCRGLHVAVLHGRKSQPHLGKREPTGARVGAKGVTLHEKNPTWCDSVVGKKEEGNEAKR